MAVGLSSLRFSSCIAYPAPGIPHARGFPSTQLAPNTYLSRPSFRVSNLVTPRTGRQQEGRGCNNRKLQAALSQSVESNRRVGAPNLENVDITKLVQALEEASAKGREVIMAAVDNYGSIDYKGATDLVTDTDRKREEAILTVVRKYFPDHLILGEEGGCKWRPVIRISLIAVLYKGRPVAASVVEFAGGAFIWDTRTFIASSGYFSHPSWSTHLRSIGNSGGDEQDMPKDLTIEEGRWQSSTEKSLQEKRSGEAYKMNPQFEAMFIVRAKRCTPFEREAAANLSRPSRQAFATILLLCNLPTVLTQMPRKLLAEEAKKEAASNDQSFLGGVLSLFDSNETTKQGKNLPKASLESAREVLQSLRASFSEDSQNDSKFRRNADSAKGAIRDYISNWRVAKPVDAEDSYHALERALRVLSEFYSKKGPSAVLPKDVRVRILEDLQQADHPL